MSIADLSNAPTRIGPESNGRLLTPEEYDAVTDWEEYYRYELIQGVLIVSPPPAIGERSPNDYLGYLLRLYQETHPQGGSLDETAPEQEIAIGDNRRRADRVAWAGLGRPVRPLDDVPTIAIEFVSDSRRDRHRDYAQKRKEYTEAGVGEYWVIDRFRREMTAFRGLDEEFVTPESGVSTTPLLPGFELPLAALLARADRYDQTAGGDAGR